MGDLMVPARYSEGPLFRRSAIPIVSKLHSISSVQLCCTKVTSTHVQVTKLSVKPEGKKKQNI